MRQKYLATQRVKKVIKIEYDEERPSTIIRTIEVLPDNISVNIEEQVSPIQVSPRTTMSSKKRQVIGAKVATSSATTSVNPEEQVAPRQLNLRTTRSSKKGQLIGAKAVTSLKATTAKVATWSTSKKNKTRSKIPIKSKMQFISDNDLPKLTEINNLLASAKPTKSLSRLLQVDDKMEENRFPVNNEELIVGKLSIKWKKLTILKS